MVEFEENNLKQDIENKLNNVKEHFYNLFNPVYIMLSKFADTVKEFPEMLLNYSKNAEENISKYLNITGVMLEDISVQREILDKSEKAVYEIRNKINILPKEISIGSLPDKLKIIYDSMVRINELGQTLESEISSLDISPAVNELNKVSDSIQVIGKSMKSFENMSFSYSNIENLKKDMVNALNIINLFSSINLDKKEPANKSKVQVHKLANYELSEKGIIDYLKEMGDNSSILRWINNSVGADNDDKKKQVKKILKESNFISVVGKKYVLNSAACEHDKPVNEKSYESSVVTVKIENSLNNNLSSNNIKKKLSYEKAKQEIMERVLIKSIKLSANFKKLVADYDSESFLNVLKDLRDEGLIEKGNNIIRYTNIGLEKARGEMDYYLETSFKVKNEEILTFLTTSPDGVPYRELYSHFKLKNYEKELISYKITRLEEKGELFIKDKKILIKNPDILSDSENTFEKDSDSKEDFQNCKEEKEPVSPDANMQ